eukprot:GEMP01096429.1.p1 GENE.GEMP01096429.1~~GEMP01096429.1.p1  ORF type:complete len:183 (+),score=23.27 GEMP01096429.1:68-616(+)
MHTCRKSLSSSANRYAPPVYPSFPQQTDTNFLYILLFRGAQTSLGAQAFGIGDTVLCRVVRLQQDKAEVTLLAVKQELTWVRFRTRVARGQIRKQDVRSFEIDQVSVSDCFRIGDVVQAKVVAKTSPFVLLSTTADNMGVVLATSIANAPMRPVSWEYMICTATGKKELRKVAKPVAGNARG